MSLVKTVVESLRFLFYIYNSTNLQGNPSDRGKEQSDICPCLGDH